MYKKEALGSLLTIESNIELSEIDIVYIENKLSSFETKYSRFIAWNYLDDLNKSWTSIIDDEFKALFNLCLLLII